MSVPASGRADELRRAFDASFAHAPAEARAAVEDVLAIRVGGDPYALRLAEVASLHADAKIAAMPSPIAALLGLTGVRNALLAVYDLRALLGCRTDGAARWLIVARGADPIGLGFDDVEAHVRIEAAAPAAAVGERGLVRGAVAIGGAMRPLIHLASVIEAIEGRVRQRGAPGER